MTVSALKCHFGFWASSALKLDLNLTPPPSLVDLLVVINSVGPRQTLASLLQLVPACSSHCSILNTYLTAIAKFVVRILSLMPSCQVVLLSLLVLACEGAFKLDQADKEANVRNIRCGHRFNLIISLNIKIDQTFKSTKQICLELDLYIILLYQILNNLSFLALIPPQCRTVSVKLCVIFKFTL